MLLDIVVIILLVLGFWQGLSRGLVRAAAALAGSLGGLWFAAWGYIPLAKFVGEHLALKGIFARVLIPVIGGFLPKLDAQVGGVTAGLPQNGFPPSLWMPLLGLKAGVTSGTREMLLADAVVKLLSFLIIFGLVKGVADFLGGLLGKILPLFLLGPLNRLGGGLLMLVDSLLNLVITVGMLTPVVLAFSIGSSQNWLVSAWQNSSMIAHLNGGWALLTPLLQQVFHMV